MFGGFVIKFIDTKTNPQTIKEKVVEFSELVYFQIVMTILSIVGGYLIRGSDLMPKLLGGSFEYHVQIANWPVEIPSNGKKIVFY